MEQNHQGQVIQGINVRILSSEIIQDLTSDTKCCTENSYKYQKLTVDLKEPVFDWQRKGHSVQI